MSMCPLFYDWLKCSSAADFSDRVRFVRGAARVRTAARPLGCRSPPRHAGASWAWRLLGRPCCSGFGTPQCAAAPRGRAPGLRASWAASRTRCRRWRRRGRRVNVAGSLLPWSCRCTARWKAPGSTGSCTCSPAPCPGAAAAAAAGARSWKVFRSQCLQMRETGAHDAQKQENGLAADDWCEGADDWGSDSEAAPPPQLTLDFGNDSIGAKDRDFTAQLQDLHLQDTVLGAAPRVSPGEEMALPSVVPQFLPYYICVVEEEDYRDFVSLDHAHSLLREYQQKEGMDMDQLLSQSLPSDGDEKYEKTIIKSGDKTFYKFMKRIAACQEQILRYSWSGEPLFLTCPPSEVTQLPACSHCGGRRTFEFQLMPALVSMLRSTNLGLSVEFGTILIYTCEKSCWPQNHQTPMEELCIIQEDPDESLFK
ncbi:programmed cell death protein 2-like [Vulpes lagopus]|uniref:programmed cell death protein 2-like n=1 Tax=Vulpes lagopus TaxID=494514 RepID=UPI001BC90B6F|nr:programmed cell death protein 2-like [Vulpes lagopus]